MCFHSGEMPRLLPGRVPEPVGLLQKQQGRGVPSPSSLQVWENSERRQTVLVCPGPSGPCHCPKGIRGPGEPRPWWKSGGPAPKSGRTLPGCPGEFQEERRSSPPSFGVLCESWGEASGISKGVSSPTFLEGRRHLVLGLLDAFTVLVGAPSRPRPVCPWRLSSMALPSLPRATASLSLPGLSTSRAPQTPSSRKLGLVHWRQAGGRSLAGRSPPSLSIPGCVAPGTCLSLLCRFDCKPRTEPGAWQHCCAFSELPCVKHRATPAGTKAELVAENRKAGTSAWGSEVKWASRRKPIYKGWAMGKGRGRRLGHSSIP